MKKVLVLLLFIITITLVGCTSKSLDYSNFANNSVSNYSTSETISKNRYVLYYYDSTDEPSKDLKKNILNFFNNFNLLEYYLFDTSKAQLEISTFGAYTGEPIIYVVSSNEVYETYTGSKEINVFINDYNNIEFDYSLFENQHLTSYEEILNIEKDVYILYYYLPNCPHCMKAKPDFLPWAFSRSAEDVYFMDGTQVDNADDIPTELVILNSGTPILVIMSNGKFANEFYSGEVPVIDYINSIGTGEIIPKDMDLDYSDFTDDHFIDYSDSLSVSDNLHFEYYYSPYCSHCNDIKFKILKFFNDLTEVDYYMMDTSTATGVNVIPGFIGTPSLYLVDDNGIVAEYIGSYQISELIKDYQNEELDLTIYE